MLRALVAGHVGIDLIPELAGPADAAPGGAADRPGWDGGRRGIFIGYADSALSAAPRRGS